MRCRPPRRSMRQRTRAGSGRPRRPPCSGRAAGGRAEAGSLLRAAGGVAQDRERAALVVGDHQVGPAVAVQILRHQKDGGCAGGSRQRESGRRGRSAVGVPATVLAPGSTILHASCRVLRGMENVGRRSPLRGEGLPLRGEGGSLEGEGLPSGGRRLPLGGQVPSPEGQLLPSGGQLSSPVGRPSPGRGGSASGDALRKNGFSGPRPVASFYRKERPFRSFERSRGGLAFPPSSR
jgi:hypothetical protein